MINPEKIKSVQAKIKAALDLIEKEDNVQISFGNCSYTPAYYKTGMTVTSQEKSEKVDNLFSSISKRLGFTQNIIVLPNQWHIRTLCDVNDFKSIMVLQNNSLIYEFRINNNEELETFKQNAFSKNK